MKESDSLTPGSQDVDFLVVTAVKDEYDAVLRLLPDPKMQGPDIVASIPGVESAPDFYRVALIVTGQSNAVAQAAVSNAINRCRPLAVILVGIAAGFTEAGVGLGDILLPSWIVPYEHAK